MQLFETLSVHAQAHQAMRAALDACPRGVGVYEARPDMERPAATADDQAH